MFLLPPILPLTRHSANMSAVLLYPHNQHDISLVSQLLLIPLLIFAKCLWCVLKKLTLSLIFTGARECVSAHHSFFMIPGNSTIFLITLILYRHQAMILVNRTKSLYQIFLIIHDTVISNLITLSITVHIYDALVMSILLLFHKSYLYN